MNPIVIIGTGLAGYTLAKEFRKLDTQTPLTLITKSQGHFYSKPLLSTALSYKKTPEALPISDANKMSTQLNAEILTKTEVTKINPKQQTITLHSKKTLSYSKLIIASGAAPIKAPITGSGASDIHSVNDLEDYATFRETLKHKEHITILGAGLVGCEFANDLINTKHKVDVVALSPYPVDRFLPEPIGLTLKKALKTSGVNWHLNDEILSIEKTPAGYSLTLTQETLQTDMLLSAIGLRAKTKIAQMAGLMTNRGIVVNHQLQTSDPHIYALGDCAQVNGLLLFFIAPILHCAKTLAQVLNGEDAKLRYPVMPIALKTPACPIVVCPPSQTLKGDWKIEGKYPNLKASYFDEHQQLQGFALSGSMTKERLGLTQRLSAIF